MDTKYVKTTIKVRLNSTPNLSQALRCAGRCDTVALRLPKYPGTVTLQTQKYFHCHQFAKNITHGAITRFRG
jgi:hypothetical protein